jgi:hypothetical protein
MGIGHEIWQVESMKRARAWTIDNIKVDLQRLGMRNLNFIQNLDKWREL